MANLEDTEPSHIRQHMEGTYPGCDECERQEPTFKLSTQNPQLLVGLALDAVATFFGPEDRRQLIGAATVLAAMFSADEEDAYTIVERAAKGESWK